ncbi:MAG TPA: YceI family protein [Gemmatimonadales bacterium]|nr:YceI family protein [Gemmatimonadales bacterium]
MPPRTHWAVTVLLASTVTHLAAQTPLRLVIDQRTSLAWWQMDPHYEHLWATTCPADPSWQPGEGRDPGQYTDYSTRPTTIAAGRSDARVPLFPRYRVRPVCREAVRGEIAVADTVRWRGVRGTVTLVAESLFTGLNMRDLYARRAVLETARYPEITFTVDSLVDIRRGAGDTLRAIAVGTFGVHGVTKPMRVPTVAWRESGGLRVQAQFSVPASALTDEFQMSKWALGMGVVMRRWKTLHMGIDVILRPGGV